MKSHRQQLNVRKKHKKKKPKKSKRKKGHKSRVRRQALRSYFEERQRRQFHPRMHTDYTDLYFAPIGNAEAIPQNPIAWSRRPMDVRADERAHFSRIEGTVYDRDSARRDVNRTLRGGEDNVPEDVVSDSRGSASNVNVNSNADVQRIQETRLLEQTLREQQLFNEEQQREADLRYDWQVGETQRLSQPREPPDADVQYRRVGSQHQSPNPVPHFPGTID